jgi:hypothetical protein
MKATFVKPDIKQFKQWVEEAQLASQEWRGESWIDASFYDGQQWSTTDYQKAVDAGVNPLTINRIFPTINLILGSQVINKYDISAIGRTQEDAEISQVMTEGVKFVMDQWDGEYLITQAFKDSVIPGFGCLSPCFSTDPRYEKVKIAYRDWKEIWWDPFASPWFDSTHCRYVFYQRWMDLSDLMALFPNKADELDNQFSESAGSSKSYSGSIFDDEAMLVEEKRRIYSSAGWIESRRRRVRPVEMWYTIFEKAWFATYDNGNVYELLDKMPAVEQYQLISGAQEVVGATVRKMRVATFLGDIVCQDTPSPYHHTMYPFVPFIAYTDRYMFPYGVPRQLRDQNIEVNKRRSMALTLLNARRVITEENVVSSNEELQELYREANKPDGFLVVAEGKMDKIKIVEQAQLAPGQVSLLEQSEREIEQISGANAEMAGYASNVLSGEAIQKRQNSGSTIISPLFDNLRRSIKILGTQINSLIQQSWNGEKVLRVTDRLSGAERFVMLNKKIYDDRSGTYIIENNITQGKYDIVITDTPSTDTVREKNMELIIEWVKKSPPEIIPHLMNIAFELSNIPNKDLLLARIRPLLGLQPGEEDLTPLQVKQKVLAELEAKQAEEQKLKNDQDAQIQLTLERLDLENKKLQAEIAKILTLAKSEKDRVDTGKAKLDLEGYKAGFDIQERINELELERQKLETEKLKNAEELKQKLVKEDKDDGKKEQG